MTLFQSLSLAFVQGVTEFLPVSSSGHLTLLQYLFGLKPSLTLDVILNTASLLSVLVYFSRQTKYFFANLKYILVASIPAAVVGVLFKNQIDLVFSNAFLLAPLFLVTFIFLISTKFTKVKDGKMTYSKAIVIGLFQVIAILPAVSRSGTTISIALLLGLSSINAFNFSFALFIPASFGALILEARNIKDLAVTGQSFEILSAFVLTFLIGLVALNLLKKVVIGRHLWIFAFYCLLISALSLFVVR